MPYTIYTLRDPRTGDIRYVGATGLSLPARLRFHLADVCHKVQGSPRVQWLRELAAVGLEPTIQAVEVIGTDDSQKAGGVEQSWIELLGAQGHNLLNVRRGGGGLGSSRRGLSTWAMSRLGTVPDRVIAHHEGKHTETVASWRRRLGIQPYRGTRMSKSKNWFRWNFWITKSQKIRLKESARLMERSQADIIREALDLYLVTVLKSPEMIEACELAICQRRAGMELEESKDEVGAE